MRSHFITPILSNKKNSFFGSSTTSDQMFKLRRLYIEKALENKLTLLNVHGIFAGERLTNQI